MRHLKLYEEFSDEELKAGLPANEIRDPHHGMINKWKYENKKLYHNLEGTKRWVEVNRVSFTPARFLAIASIIKDK